MATDFLLFWMLQPTGLAVIATAILAPLSLWRLILGKAYQHVGMWPYVTGYIGGLAGLAALCFIMAEIDYSSRVSQGLLQEAKRWSITPGWTIYLAAIFLIFVLPLFGLVGIPAAATLIRFGRFTVPTIIITVVGACVLITLII